MVRSSTTRPYKWRPKGEPLPPGGARHFAQLINARFEPETYSIPVCYRHIEGLAQSISRREMTESVLVLVDPDEVGPGIFCCFLCQKEDELGELKPAIKESIDDKN